MTAFIRSIEPEGVTISVGGEIGEVGGHNSNEEELRAYTDDVSYRVRIASDLRHAIDARFREAGLVQDPAAAP